MLLQFLAHTHFRDGRPVTANMVSFKCSVKKIVYTSLEPSRPIVVVMFRGKHSHPPWPEEKLNKDAKADLHKCIEAYGILGATAEKLDNGEPD